MINSQVERMRAYWIRNVPNKPKYWPILTIDEGLALLIELAEKDLKDPWVQSNVGGVEIYSKTDLEWVELPLNSSDRLELEETLAKLELSVSRGMLDLYFAK